MKRRFIWFLALWFTLVPLITVAQEGNPAPRSIPGKKFSQKRKKYKSYRKKTRKKPRRKKYASKKRKYRPRLAGKRSVAKSVRPVATAKPVAPKVTTPKKISPKVSTPQLKKLTASQAPGKLVVSATGWRANVRRTVATTLAGTIAPFESFTTLGALLRTLPDQGEVRVRYGIYPGAKGNAPPKRFEQERRNVAVTCWLHGVRYDSASPDENDREVQLLIGTTADTATATMMFARIPGPLRGVGVALQDEFTIAREQLADVIGGGSPLPQWQWIPPRQIVVEGGIFFNGLRDPGIRNDAQRDPARPLTVWEITPVISVTPISLAE